MTSLNLKMRNSCCDLPAFRTVRITSLAVLAGGAAEHELGRRLAHQHGDDEVLHLDLAGALRPHPSAAGVRLCPS